MQSRQESGLPGITVVNGLGHHFRWVAETKLERLYISGRVELSLGSLMRSASRGASQLLPRVGWGNLEAVRMPAIGQRFDLFKKGQELPRQKGVTQFILRRSKPETIIELNN